MKKLTVFLVTLTLILALSLGGFISASNHLVTLDETVKEKWAQVENVYQRRLDLIPNLVNTVKGYAKHESQVLETVIQARAQVGQVKVKNVDDLKNFDQAQSQLSQSLSRLLMVTERYPELKADRNFLELQSQLEGTENRISIERMRFNEAARDFNRTIRSFPYSIVAGLKEFHEKSYFQADQSAKNAPKVEF